MKKLIKFLAVATVAIASATSAHAALFTNNFGTMLGNPNNSGNGSPSNCDDCFTGPINFTGAGQSINFFGTAYSGLFVGSNGYVTFGAGASNFSTQALDTQTIRPMIAGSFTDLDSRSDSASNVYVNDTTPGQLIATWESMGHYALDYSVRSTFQLVIRSDQFVLPQGEGQIGFFYGLITDPSSTSAGFGDGLDVVNPGEVAFLSMGNGTTLSNREPAFFNLEGGTPTLNAVPEPGSLALFGLTVAGLGLMRRRSQSVKSSPRPVLA